MRKCYLLTLSLLVCAAGAAQADVIYQVSVNTSSLTGTTGSLDFQFNFGNVGPIGGATQGASVTVSNLTGGSNGIGAASGQVSGGPFPAPVTIGNGKGFNDYFETFAYGGALKVSLDFSGPAVNAPDGFSTGSSDFVFSIFSDPNGTIGAPGTDVNGIAGTVTINPDGTSTTAAVSPNLSFSPEPGSMWLTLAAGLLLGIPAFSRRRSVS